jgi:hypothetical protein
MVPSHEEEGRASGHDVHLSQQGLESMGKSLDSTLLKGTFQFPKVPLNPYDIPESSGKGMHFSKDPTEAIHKKELFPYNLDTKEPKLPRLDCPEFNGEHPRVWKENVRNISPCFMSRCIYGHLLPQSILMIMLLYGSNLMKPNTV